MQQQSGTKENVTSNTQSSANETDKQDYLTETHDIKGSPFTLRRVEEKWFITIGDYRLTDPTKTGAEALMKLKDEQWHITTKLIAIAIDKLSKIKQHDNENNLE